MLVRNYEYLAYSEYAAGHKPTKKVGSCFGISKFSSFFSFTTKYDPHEISDFVELAKALCEEMSLDVEISLEVSKISFLTRRSGSRVSDVYFPMCVVRSGIESSQLKFGKRCVMLFKKGFSPLESILIASSFCKESNLDQYYFVRDGLKSIDAYKTYKQSIFDTIRNPLAPSVSRIISSYTGRGNTVLSYDGNDPDAMIEIYQESILNFKIDNLSLYLLDIEKAQEYISSHPNNIYEVGARINIRSCSDIQKENSIDSRKYCLPNKVICGFMDDIYRDSKIKDNNLHHLIIPLKTTENMKFLIDTPLTEVLTKLCVDSSSFNEMTNEFKDKTLSNVLYNINISPLIIL